MMSNGWLRAASFTAAAIFSLVVMLYPYLLVGVVGWRVHTGLPLMMLGGAGLYMHGLGFVPRHWATRFLFHPVTAWLLFLAGIAVLAI
jgi:predicted membrane protein